MFSFQFKHEFNGLPVHIFADDYVEAVYKLKKLKLPKFNIDHWILEGVIEDVWNIEVEDDED